MTNGLEDRRHSRVDIQAEKFHTPGGSYESQASFFAVALVFWPFVCSGLSSKRTGRRQRQRKKPCRAWRMCAKWRRQRWQEAWPNYQRRSLTERLSCLLFGLTGKVEFIAKAPNKMLHVVTLGDGQFVQNRGLTGESPGNPIHKQA